MGDCGVGHFLALMAKPPFKYFPTGCPFPVGFVLIAKSGKALGCNPRSVGSNPTGDFG